MTQGWTPPPDPGYRVDGALPPGFDVAGLLAQLYGGRRLTRGMAIPVGGATVTVTAEYLDVPAAAPPAMTPAPAYPAAAQPPVASVPNVVEMTPPPGMSDPMQIALWLKELKASGQIAPGTVVHLGGGTTTTQTFALGGGAPVDLRALLASVAGGGAVSGMTSSAFMTGATHGDIHAMLDRVLTTMSAATLQRAGGVGRLLGSQGGAAESIRAHDPGFTEAGLIADATASLWALAVARAENRPDAVRRHLAPPLYEREVRQMQIDGLQSRRRVVEGLEVRSATIDECGAGALGDHATVRFRLWGADRDLDQRGKRIAGDKKPTDWHELWILARASGATTPPPGSLMAPCATCGFAGADPAADVCPGCGHPLPLPPGRWLVSGITRVEPRHG